MIVESSLPNPRFLVWGLAVWPVFVVRSCQKVCILFGGLGWSGSCSCKHQYSVVGRTKILHVYGFGSIWIALLRGEIPQHTGNPPGNSTRRILVCKILVQSMAGGSPVLPRGGFYHGAICLDREIRRFLLCGQKQLVMQGWSHILLRQAVRNGLNTVTMHITSRECLGHHRKGAPEIGIGY